LLSADAELIHVNRAPPWAGPESETTVSTVTRFRAVLTAAVMLMLLQPLTHGAGLASQGYLLTDQVNAAPLDLTPITGRRGYDTSAPERRYGADANGVVTVLGEETDLFQFSLRPSATDIYAAASRGDYTGYMRAGSALFPLPIGSSLNAETGAFTWQPGPGFLGSYNLVFVRWLGTQAIARQEVRFVLNPQGSNRVGAQVIIDTPGPQANVSQPFLLAGWAIDLDAFEGTGVDTLHVWAYPITCHVPSATCHDPIFLGATAYGGKRPDVGAIFGERFTSSGYGLVVDGLEAGQYDVAVFAWSTATGGFVPAKVVRVTISR
jgi:hypothetical protein